MRTSLVRRKLKQREPVLCTKMNTQDPVVIDMIGLIGFDCVWLCAEHIPLDGDRLAHLIRTADMNDLDTVVRVSKGGYSNFIHPLELGASGIMVPHCMSAGEARELVRMTRFHPLGLRALDGGNADGSYCMIPLLDYMHSANDNTFLVVQVEDMEAVEQVDEIAAVEGVDVVFVGPGDLSQSLGIPGETEHPAVQEAIERVALACERYGRIWGLPVNPINVERYLGMGALFCTMGADVVGLQEYYKAIRTRFSSLGFEFRSKV